MKNTVIFDMDGVLIDSEPKYFSELQKYLRSEGVEPRKVDLNEYIGTSDEASWRMLISDAELRDKLRAGYYRYRRLHPIDYNSILKPGVRPLLEGLRSGGFVVALASATAADLVQRTLNECNIQDYFSLVVSGESVKHNKPAPDIYFETMRELNAAPENCLVIEDSKNGIAAAKAAGIETWAVKHADYTVDQSQADRVVSGMDEIRTLLLGE